MSALHRMRPARPEDAHFVANSWIRSLRAESKRLGEELGYVDLDTYGDGHRALIARILPLSTVLVSTAIDDDNTLYGWACGVPGVLHYVFTKLDSRGLGFARELIHETVGPPRWRCTHYTGAVKRWKAAGLATYDPYPLWCP